MSTKLNGWRCGDWRRGRQGGRGRGHCSGAALLAGMAHAARLLARRALLGLGGGRRWRRALTAAARGGACWARAARRVCGVLGWRGARRCGGACTARGPRAESESTHASERGCRGACGAVQWRGGAGVGLGGALWALGAVGFGAGVLLVLAGVALAGRRGGGRGRWSGAAGLAQAAGLARRALLGLGGGRRWRRALTAAARGGACWARAARRVCGVLGWRGARRCGGACTARGPRAVRESTHAPGRGCREAYGGCTSARWGVGPFGGRRGLWRRRAFGRGVARVGGRGARRRQLAAGVGFGAALLGQAQAAGLARGAVLRGLGRRAALALRTHGCGAWRRVLGLGGAACVRRAWLAWCAALWRGVHCAGAACST